MHSGGRNKFVASRFPSHGNLLSTVGVHRYVGRCEAATLITWLLGFSIFSLVFVEMVD